MSNESNQQKPTTSEKPPAPPLPEIPPIQKIHGAEDTTNNIQGKPKN
jgi:hypothetical protein